MKELEQEYIEKFRQDNEKLNELRSGFYCLGQRVLFADVYYSSFSIVEIMVLLIMLPVLKLLLGKYYDGFLILLLYIDISCLISMISSVILALVLNYKINNKLHKMYKTNQLTNYLSTLLCDRGYLNKYSKLYDNVLVTRLWKLKEIKDKYYLVFNNKNLELDSIEYNYYSSLKSNATIVLPKANIRLDEKGHLVDIYELVRVLN